MTAVKVAKIASERNTLLSRVRMQLGGGLLVAAFLPYVLRFWLDSDLIALENLNNSLVGTILAVTAGYLGFRQTSHYPGMRAGSGILPSFAFGYLLISGVFLMLRLDYSRLQFIASFGICVTWFYLVYRGLAAHRAVFGLIPFGRAPQLTSIPGPQWVVLDHELAKLGRFDAIVADLHAEIPDEWERFIADQALNEVPVLHVKQVRESLTGRVEIEHLSENEFGSLIPGIAYAKFKRVVDFVTALLLFVPVTVALVPVAIAIRLDSPGPILFRQERVGYRGHLFTLYKLRTMRVRAPASEDGSAVQDAITAAGDARITRIGRVLRKYRVDELPQLINVLKGEMSWIGPRPEAAALSRWYESELPFYRYRHIVRPGLTGWAQVNQGHVADVSDVLWKLHYDFYYIRNFSFWLDLLIVGKTVRTVLSGFGHK